MITHYPITPITPIAHMHDDLYELNLVLRNYIATEETPWVVYHPWAQYHHINEAYIGLINMMGIIQDEIRHVFVKVPDCAQSISYLVNFSNRFNASYNTSSLLAK